MPCYRPSAATASWLLLATYGGYTIDMVQPCTWEDPCLGEPPITKQRERYRRRSCAFASRWQVAPDSLENGEADDRQSCASPFPRPSALPAGRRNGSSCHEMLPP